jgi:hypothetical protein
MNSSLARELILLDHTEDKKTGLVDPVLRSVELDAVTSEHGAKLAPNVHLGAVCAQGGYPDRTASSLKVHKSEETNAPLECNHHANSLVICFRGKYHPSTRAT